MQIFSPTQVKTEAEKRTAQDMLRAKNIASVTTELIKAKEEAEKSFEKTMKLQREEAELWYTQNVTRKNELKKELEELEQKRKEALSPLLIKAEDIKSAQQEIHARKLELDAREAELEEDSRLLMQKLDQCSTTEHDLNEREKKVKRMELASEAQKNLVAKEMKQFNLQLEQFQKESEERETEFAYRQSELDARKNLADERDKSFIEREKEIRAAQRLLADQRLLLEQGFEELRRKKHGNTK